MVDPSSTCCPFDYFGNATNSPLGSAELKMDFPNNWPCEMDMDSVKVVDMFNLTVFDMIHQDRGKHHMPGLVLFVGFVGSLVGYGVLVMGNLWLYPNHSNNTMVFESYLKFDTKEMVEFFSVHDCSSRNHTAIPKVNCPVGFQTRMHRLAKISKCSLKSKVNRNAFENSRKFS